MKKFCKALGGAPMRVFNDSKQTKSEEYMGLLELERGFRVIKILAHLLSKRLNYIYIYIYTIA